MVDAVFTARAVKTVHPETMDWIPTTFALADRVPWDILLPIALVLLYVFQRAFFNQDEAEGGPPGGDDTEARRIQEEIRRKIVERQQGRSTGQQGGAPPAPVREEPAQVEPEPSFYERSQPGERPFQQQQPPPIPGHRETPPAIPPEPAGSKFQDIEEQLQAQREKMREARKAREEAIARSRKKTGRAEIGRKRTMRPIRRTGNLREDLLADLSTPDALRRSFLLKELLDRPVSVRDGGDYSFGNSY